MPLQSTRNYKVMGHHVSFAKDHTVSANGLQKPWSRVRQLPLRCRTNLGGPGPVVRPGPI
jgi:hypothetical protein